MRSNSAWKSPELRIASSRSRDVPYPAALVAFYAVAAVVAIVFAIIIARRLLPRGFEAGTEARISTADAFSIGGLARLHAGSAAGATSPIEGNIVVSYYGTPRTPSMGILGQHTPEEAADLLAQRVARFRELNAGTPVLAALHLVYGVAQPQSDKDGLYVSYVDDHTVRQFIDLARRRGFVLILDLQIGHSTALAEIQKVEQYLEEPDVFVALDPEFALGGPTRPGEAIGSIDASDVNAAQRYLARLSEQYHLPKKMLIVHQFQAEMISNADAIERRDDVDLVIDMDGYGPADIKQVKYLRYGAAPYAPFGGMKIFLAHDTDPLTEQQLLSLRPRPSLFVYQ